MTPDLQIVVQQLAQALGETERAPQRQLEAVVRTLSVEVALRLLQEAQAIEAQGGLLTIDSSRRRTLGGVFFQLARQQMTPEQRRAAFGPLWQKKRKQLPAGAPQPAGPVASAGGAPPIGWGERGQLIDEAKQQPGETRTVKVTIIGRPGKVIERAAFTLLQIKHTGPLPALPKGIPVPATVPTTTYLVYIGAKQWRGVAAAIKNPEDALIVEGTQIYDAEFGAIAVFATNVTTRLLQQAKRQQQQQ